MQGDLFSGDIIHVAIERMRLFEPPEGYFLAFSGGKDSVVIKALADEAGVKYDAHYHLVPVDPPELIRFIREKHSDVAVDRSGHTLIGLIKTNGFPTRTRRWCCKHFKEAGGKGRMVMTGIRQAESPRRKSWGLLSYAKNDRTKRVFNPIIDWEDSDVWGYIHSCNINYCKLYDEGWKRLGCVGCPMVRDTKAQVRWPKVMNAWKVGMRRWFEKKPRPNWSSFEKLWEAWLDRDASLMGDLKQEEKCDLFGSFGMEANTEE